MISLYEWGVFYTPEKERKNGDTNDGCYCDHVYWSAGRQIFIAAQFKQVESDLQVVCTLLLIFSMGVLLGSRENFLEELSTLGIQSVIFFLLPSVGSVLLVYPLTRRFLENKKTGKGRK